MDKGTIGETEGNKASNALREIRQERKTETVGVSCPRHTRRKPQSLRAPTADKLSDMPLGKPS